MQKISWTNHMRNKEVLHTAKEDRNILHAIKQRKANWIGHILCRNCLLKQVIEEMIDERREVMGRQGKRHKKLKDDLKETSG